MPVLRRVHLAAGALTLVAFLASGMYMRSIERPEDLGRLVMFTSRHIYILAAALVNLVLGAYVGRSTHRAGRTLQHVGSFLLVASCALLIAAFVFEPMAGRARTAVSSFGVIALFAGSLLHVVGGVKA